MGKRLLLESAMVAAFLTTLMLSSFGTVFAYPGPDEDEQYCPYGSITHVYLLGYYEYGVPGYYDTGYWYSSRSSIDPYYKFGALYVHYWSNQENNPYFSSVGDTDDFWISPQPGYFEGVTDFYGQTGSYFYVTFPNFFWVQTYTAHNHAT